MKKLFACILALLICMSAAPASFAADKGYEIENETVQVFQRPLGGSAVQVYFELQNTSDKPLYCKPGTVELEDAEGHLIGTSKSVGVNPEVVLPGETAYYTDVIYFEDAIDFTPELYVKPKVEEAKVPQIMLDVSDISFSTDSLGILKALGRVKNNTGTDIDGLINLSVLLYDNDQNYIGELSTILTDDIEDGGRTSFELSGLMLPNKVSEKDIDSFVAFCWLQQFQF